jgi:hypothetical protein
MTCLGLAIEGMIALATPSVSQQGGDVRPYDRYGGNVQDIE